MPSERERQSAYLWEPGGEVLRNEFGEHDPAALRRLKNGAVFLRQLEIARGEAALPRAFDAEHLRAIHRHLYQDVYAWAGTYRTVRMTKGTNPVGFAAPNQIARYLADAHRIVEGTDWTATDRDAFARAAGTVYAYVNQAHPFREGSGRAGKVFLEQLAERSPFRIDYSRVPKAVWNQASELAGPDLGRYEPVPGTLIDVFRVIARRRARGSPRPAASTA